MIQLEMPQEVPVGETFSYKGERTKYVCQPRWCGCEDCVFLFTNKHGIKKRVNAARHCQAFACASIQRADCRNVKAVLLERKAK